MSEPEHNSNNSPAPLGEDPRRPTVLVETSEKTNVIGFTAEGWNWNDTTPAILNENLDITELKKKFVDLYRIAGFQHKEILFSWALIAPFLYVYRSFENIMPILLITGPKQIGKTAWLQLVKHLYWFSEIQSEYCMNSPSRLENMLANSTFPVLIDACSPYFNPFCGDILKGYTTAEIVQVRNHKVGRSNRFKWSSTPLTAPVALVFQEVIMNDVAFKSRCIELKLEFLMENPAWDSIRTAFPKGGLTRLIYEYTKKWTLKDLKQFVDSIPSDHIPGGQRQKAMYVALAAGAKLLYGIFGIIVDLTLLTTLFLEA